MKKNKYTLVGCLLTFFFLWAACATTGTLTGGPRDETPPKWLVEISSPNFMTNTSSRGFYLEFDEYVKVDDIFNQVVVSPPLVYNPKVEARGKRVNFEFNEKEELKDATTYTINFGESIRDLNEGNKAENIRFVFSTGDIIDSLSIRGIIVDAITGNPVEGSLALLYDSPSDSSIIKERPYYFGRADKSGRFIIENIKEGVYQLVGLKDENQNLKFDDPKEQVGYIDSMLPIGEEVPEQKIALFSERKPSFIDKIDSTTQGLLKIVYKEELFLPSLDIRDSTIITLTEIKPKEILIWHYALEKKRWWLNINQEDGRLDSIRIWSYPLDSTMTNREISCTASTGILNSQHPDSSFSISFTPTLRKVEKDVFSLISNQDTTFRGETKLLTTSEGLRNNLEFSALQLEGDYSIIFREGDLTDMYGRVLDTTLSCPIKMLPRETFSNLMLTINGFNPEMTYVLQLLWKDQKLKEWTVKETETWSGTFFQLKPEEYEIYVLEDLNQNGQWDAGRFLEKTQPERNRKLKVTGLRSNWDIELELSVRDWYISTDPEEDQEDGMNEESDKDNNE